MNLQERKKFTNIEFRILKLRCKGHTEKEISEMLGITTHAYGHRVNQIYKIIGCRSISGMVTYAMEHDFIENRKSDYDEVRTCLKDLVELKAYKDEHGKDSYYHQKRQELWERAKELLKM